MLNVKAIKEGRSVSELVRQAVQEYKPMDPKPSYCPNCQKKSEEEFWDDYFEELEGRFPTVEKEPERVQMISFWHSDTRNITVAVNTPKGYEEHEITITGIPAEKCPVCGTVTTDFGLMSDIEEAEVRMVNKFVRQDNWPKEISLEELSRLM